MLAKSSKTGFGYLCVNSGSRGFSAWGFASDLGGFACAMGLLLGLLWFYWHGPGAPGLRILYPLEGHDFAALVRRKCGRIAAAPFPARNRGRARRDDRAFQATIFSTTPPKEEGVGTMVTPASDRISTFSWADSPKADTIAPACPMRRPLGAERPAT